jgi:hypothetical protein
VLIVVVLALGIYVIELIAFMRGVRRQAEQEKRSAERLDAMAAELAELRGRFEELRATTDGLRRAPQTSGQYREAVEMAERGVDAAAVAESCGISRAEADLIVALHRTRAA